jgi:histidinol-phosphate/aromatic aminotransferase/cobyric acid decarboxylase-like protein
LRERERLANALREHPAVRRVWPSDTNFLLVEFADAERALAQIRAAGLIVRDVRSQPGLGGALRITVGAPEQNTRLLEGLS